LGSREDEPSTITLQGQKVAVVEEFVYLGSLVHCTIQSCPDISHHNAITHADMQNQTIRSGSQASPSPPN